MNNNGGIHRFVRDNDEDTYEEVLDIAKGGAPSKATLPYRTVRQVSENPEMVDKYGDKVAVPITVIEDISDRHPELTNASKNPISPYSEISTRVSSVSPTGSGDTRTYDGWVVVGYVPMTLSETNEIAFMDFNSAGSRLEYNPDKRIKNLIRDEKLTIGVAKDVIDKNIPYKSKLNQDSLFKQNRTSKGEIALSKETVAELLEVLKDISKALKS